MKLPDGRKISASMACTIECWQFVLTPMCNGCKLWKVGTQSCKKFPRRIPSDILDKEYHRCPDFELNPEDPINYKTVKANIERLKDKA